MSAATHRPGPAPEGSDRDTGVPTGPIPGSSKCYRDPAGAPGGRVPFRRVHLSGGRHLDLYDASGPYTEADTVADLTVGLPSRPGMVTDRGTQLQRARDGVVTSEMAFVAAREGLRPKVVRDEVAAGHAVLPANHHHPESEPMIIGRAFRVKVNAGIAPSPAGTIGDMVRAIRWGADLVMDLSNTDTDRVLRNMPVPVGTVPLYQALDRLDGDVAALTWEAFCATVIEQADTGVDYMTVHAGLRREHLPLAAGRVSGIVSRGGAIMADWCLLHRAESFLYTHFDQLCEILARYDVTLSLGAALQPGSIADANDAAQIAELRTLGELARFARQRGVQVMVEGPGRVPMHKIPDSVRLHQQLCRNAPSYTVGPFTTDITSDRDHTAAVIGAAVAAQAGVSMLWCLPEPACLRETVIAHKLAAHTADLAKGHPHAREHDNAMSRARFELNCRDRLALSPDPDAAFTGADHFAPLYQPFP
ncbi:phosphomethylpyrimidine synthase ThiC [Mycolicibacterium goodii]|uniref:phosphomethylpyrimidine synthase ThiC n=1 Tax=Mycolicibacterium goodii TaxID=134601 RepID=UPI000C26244B|nr:phosphomethylpyrimidine synthase ThiC [Mycolicibacterium goodii]PJK24277.1 phosphomethylpyrimidine synthase ThiC [Mycolicibacterium goodii]